MKSWDKISQIDAGHFDATTAYVAVNSIRKDDMRPHIFKTHDGGATWKEIVTGMNVSGPVNVVREDGKQPGLLFSGTEREVYFSVDDGENWQSLRQNMPASSIRDLVVHENDLVIGTHGRSIWILDDVSLLRDIKMATSEPFLSQPSVATRVRFNMFSDTPLPPEEPTGQNPPDGAILDYVLPTQAQEVKLEILDMQGKVIRTFSNKDKVVPIDSTGLPHPTYWIRPQQKICGDQGHHRFVWDLRYPEPPGADRGFSIAAVYKNTPSGPVGPYVHPGKYSVRLTVDGKVVEREIDVRLDPRLSASEKDIGIQTDMSLQCYQNYNSIQAIREAIDRKLSDGKVKWKKGEKERWQSLRGTGNPDDGDILYGSIADVPLAVETLVSLQRKLLHMLVILQSADAKPTGAVLESANKLSQRAAELSIRWNALK